MRLSFIFTCLISCAFIFSNQYSFAQEVKQFSIDGKIFKHKDRKKTQSVNATFEDKGGGSGGKHDGNGGSCHDDDHDDNPFGCGDLKNRTIDGTCNNVSEEERLEWGASDIELLRSIDAQYGEDDPLNEMGGEDRLSPRAISNLVCQDNYTASNYNLSSFVFSWGQFLDHDISLTPEGETEYAPITLPANEPLFMLDIPFFRSEVHENTGESTTRQQTNLITSWIDASNVYGSHEDRANWLRTFEDGKLKTASGDLLPYNTIDGEIDSPIDPEAPSMAGDDGGTVVTFVAGDVRAAEQPGLTSLHTLFVREHNRICDELKDKGYDDDEKMYQKARKQVGAIIQHITYDEFLPALGVDISNYDDYAPSIRPDISNLFATAAYRLGHTMVTDEILLRDNNCNDVDGGSLTLLEGFFNPSVLANYGIDPILKGLSVQVQNETDLSLIDNLRNFLFGDPSSGVPVPGLDLASLNLQRGRDHGLPDYNTVRNHYLGDPANSFSDITNNQDKMSSLSAAYSDVNDIDLWVGLLAEDHTNGQPLGPTLQAILKDQFEKLRDGDRFYFENDPALKSKDRDRIRKTELSDVIERNTDLDDLPKYVFYVEPCGSGKTVQEESSSLSTQASLQVSPNPSNGQVNINFINNQEQVQSLHLLTLSGKTLVQQTANNLSNRYLDLSHLKNGTYLLQVVTNEQTYTKKVVLMH